MYYIRSASTFKTKQNMNINSEINITMSVETNLIDGIYTAPELWAKDTKGRIRFSRQFVKMVNGPGAVRSTNWDHSEEPAIHITADHINGIIDLPRGSVSAIWSETGIEGKKTLRSTPTYISVGKNIGKSNATNHLTQAISEVTSKWNKKIKRSGYTTDKASLNDIVVEQIRPMALHELPPQNEKSPFDLSGTNLWTEGDPVLVGRKLDGNRMMAFMNGNGEIILYGRGGDPPPNSLTHIREQLKFLFGEHPDMVFDGEIYRHGITHSELNGTYMNASKESSHIDFVIFDVIKPNATRSKDMIGGYIDRLTILRDLFNKINKSAIPNITLNDSELASTSGEIEKIYKKYLSEGYEGAVVRHVDSPYEIGKLKEVRSRRSLKLKPEFDAEFTIVGYKEGRGRDKGALVWILEMPARLIPDGVNPSKVPKEFSARPMGSIDDRRVLYKKMKDEFDSEYSGKPMRVLYTDKTKYGVPRFPRAVGVRE